MIRSLIHGLNKQQLQAGLLIFFIALAIPTIVLISQAFSQLKWETFHRYQTLSDELIQRIDTKLSTLISKEEARSFTDYSFLNIAGEPSASFLQRSPLSEYPVSPSIPGLIGYFQIDNQGSFSTPLLPTETSQSNRYGINRTELNNRIKLQTGIYSILSKNKLVQTRKPISGDDRHGKKDAGKTNVHRAQESITSDSDYERAQKTPAPLIVKQKQARQAQAAFDRLHEEQREKKKTQKILPKSLGRLEDLKLESRYPKKSIAAAKTKHKKPGERKRLLRKEKNVLPAQKSMPTTAGVSETGRTTAPVDIRLFNSEIDSIEISILDSGHLVLFRKVWRNKQRYIQGIIITTSVFLTSLMESPFQESSLSRTTNLLVAYRGNILSAFSTTPQYRFSSQDPQFQGDLLERAKLSKPFNDLELVFNITNLPTTGESQVITITAAILLIVFIVGFILLYRLGLAQIEVTRQQQNFVSAVSHELKTPLTSIRMYGELLREGWATDEKKNQYYDYIYNESERLSRLINNVLQLSRMTHNSLHADLKNITISELLDIIRSKIHTQVEHAGYHLRIDCDNDIKKLSLTVDTDYFTQIFINLVDNALKFSKQNGNKHIDITCARNKQHSILFSIRDYGPGIAPDQLKKIFTLFYRSENELTRETIGTGIGLALVQQFIHAMNGHIDVINKHPGAEFRVSFPLAD